MKSFAVTGSKARALPVVVIGLSGKRHNLPFEIFDITKLAREDDRFLFIHAELKICARYASLLQKIRPFSLELLGQL